MYRDDLEALRQRSRELDQALAAARQHHRDRPPAPFAWERLWLVILSVGGGMLILYLGILALTTTARENQQQRAVRAQLSQRVPAEERSSTQSFDAWIVPGGGVCAVTLSPPCRATVRCWGKRMYAGTGSCGPNGFIDGGDSFVDGTPQLEIDFARKRATLREVAWRARGDVNPETWRMDLVLP